MKTVFKMIAVLLMALTLTSCSTRFLYNQLDWLLPWYLEDYVSVESQQQPAFDATLTEFLNWHRVEQLPLYAEYVASLKPVVAQPTPHDIERHIDRLDGFINQLYHQFGVDFVPLIASLTEAQKSELITNVRAKNQDYAKEFVAIGEAAARRKGAEKMQEIFDDWLGALSPEQQQRTQAFTQQTQWMSPGLLAARKQWADRLEALLTSSPNVNQTELLTLFEQRRLLWDAELKAQYRHNIALLVTLLDTTLKNLSPAQQTHLLNRLNDYQRDFTLLSRQS